MRVLIQFVVLRVENDRLIRGAIARYLVVALVGLLAACSWEQIKSGHVSQTIQGEDQYILSIIFGGVDGSKYSALAALDYTARERSCSQTGYAVE